MYPAGHAHLSHEDSGRGIRGRDKRKGKVVLVEVGAIDESA
jgi:hypothetical protein